MTIDASEPHLDRRQRKSRAALQQALLQVIAEKPYEAITIEDITDAADLTRATFYAHYADKAALTCEAYELLVEDLRHEIAEFYLSEATVYAGAAVAAVFEHASQHANLYRMAISGAAGLEPRRVLVTALEALVAQTLAVRSERLGRSPRVPVDLSAGCFVASTLYAIERWLDGQLDGGATEIAETILHIEMRGVEWAAGFEPGDLQYESQSP